METWTAQQLIGSWMQQQHNHVQAHQLIHALIGLIRQTVSSGLLMVIVFGMQDLHALILMETLAHVAQHQDVLLTLHHVQVQETKHHVRHKMMHMEVHVLGLRALMIAQY